MSSLKKSQHYVWKHYLKPWTTNGQINCLRNGKLFKTSLDNIAQQNYFYEATPINKDELAFFNSYIDFVHPTAKESLTNLLDIYCINSISNEYNRKCGIEDFHDNIERNFIPLLDRIYEEDISFLENIEDRNKFSYFIGSQYSRTYKMRNSLIQSEIQVKDTINKENIAKLLSLFFADSIGNWVFSKSKISFLVNETNEDYITGDQPILNIQGDLNGKIVPKKFELYYPISPRLAIFLNEKESERIIIDNEERINMLNGYIESHSKEQLFAKNELSIMK